ncbi:alpha/beta fold hydrolase [soil metagenome]
MFDKTSLSNLVAEMPLEIWSGQIPSDTPGVELFVHNKRPYRMSESSPANTILLVHGSTYASRIAFDLRLGGFSMMEAIAAQGYDVWTVDIRGYGRSSRPEPATDAAGDIVPVARTEVAVRDVAAAVAHILEQRRLSRLSLLGWSWGTTLTGAFAASRPELVEKLVLLAPQWLRNSPSLADQGGALSAYRDVTIGQTRDRWLRGVPQSAQETLIPRGWFDVVAKALLAEDPIGAARTPPSFSAPNGTVADSREYWAAGKPVYDPGAIRCPVLVVHGEWDQDLPSEITRAYFATLVNAPYRRWVEIAEATHSLMLEKNRLQVFGAICQFFEERVAPEMA